MSAVVLALDTPVRFADLARDPPSGDWVLKGLDGEFAWIRRGEVHLTVPAEWLRPVEITSIEGKDNVGYDR